jgi:hemoglobin
MSAEPELQRRPRVGPGAAVGVDEAMIRDQVHAFYAKVREDPEIGPVFTARITDWGPHLERMCAFWSSVLLMTGRYHGRPMQMHAAISEITPAHFARWLALFAETARETCPPAAGALFVAKAEMIAESLKLGIGFARGELPPLKAV